MDKAVPSVVDTIPVALDLFRQFVACANMAGDVVAAKHLIGNDIPRGILTVDVHVASATHFGHTGTAKHLALGIRQGTVFLGNIRADIT